MAAKNTSNLPDKASYVHTHTLPDGTTYTHSHAHGSKNVHEHESGAPSVTGSIAAGGANTVSSVDPDKLIALLTFFVGHNEQHAEELAELIPALPEDIQDKMMLAIGTLEAANVDLQGVLDYLIMKKKEG